MGRETKVGLLIGLGIILLIGIVVGDHLSVVKQQEAANLTDFAAEAQRGLQGGADAPLIPGMTDPALSQAGAQDGVSQPSALRQDPLPMPSELNPPAQAFPAAQDGAQAPLQVMRVGAGGQLVNPTGHDIKIGAGQPLVHFVKDGQTLWHISTQYYGVGDHWKVIAQANPECMMADGGVRPGVRLVIPSLASLPQFAGQTGAPAAPGRAAPAGRSATVKQGDSLYKIAARELGSASRWKEIYECNRDQLRKPEQLKLGMVLRLPENQPAPAPAVANSTVPGGPASFAGNSPALEPATSGTTTIVLADNHAAANRPSAAEQAPAASTYTVKSGDTLYSIARNVLGKAELWQQIYQANKSQIRDPRNLTVGQKLVLPPSRA